MAAIMDTLRAVSRRMSSWRSFCVAIFSLYQFKRETYGVWTLFIQVQFLIQKIREQLDVLL